MPVELPCHTVEQILQKQALYVLIITCEKRHNLIVYILILKLNHRPTLFTG